jgi:hypothetical protein
VAVAIGPPGVTELAGPAGDWLEAGAVVALAGEAVDPLAPEDAGGDDEPEAQPASATANGAVTAARTQRDRGVISGFLLRDVSAGRRPRCRRMVLHPL